MLENGRKQHATTLWLTPEKGKKVKKVPLTGFEPVTSADPRFQGLALYQLAVPAVADDGSLLGWAHKDGRK
tara:strand:+ start:306 stop:518 length:213 start_codon:yes stop_codon:yes gene_type:complete